MTRQQGRLPEQRKTESGLGVTSHILPPLCSITITPQVARAARERAAEHHATDEALQMCGISDADLANPKGWIRA